MTLFTRTQQRLIVYRTGFYVKNSPKHAENMGGAQVARTIKVTQVYIRLPNLY
jgi:hypothetical protein